MQSAQSRNPLQSRSRSESALLAGAGVGVEKTNSDSGPESDNRFFYRIGWGNLGIVFVLLSHQNAKLMTSGKIPVLMRQMVPPSALSVPILDELGFHCMQRSHFYTKS